MKGITAYLTDEIKEDVHVGGTKIEEQEFGFALNLAEELMNIVKQFPG